MGSLSHFLVCRAMRGAVGVSCWTAGRALSCLPSTAGGRGGRLWHLGPPLAGVASRLTRAQLRLRVVDARHLNPYSIMPGYYRDLALINRPAVKYRGRTFLPAQAVEDVIAYLATLK